MSITGAKIELTLGDYEGLQNQIREAQAEAAKLRQQVIDARLADPTNTIVKVTAFAREALTVARFGIANLPPEMHPRWPFQALRNVAETISCLPDFSTDDRDMAHDLKAFANECEFHELRRAGVSAPHLLPRAIHD